MWLVWDGHASGATGSGQGGAFGPRLEAVAALLVGRDRLSRREAVACLAELGEVELSVGALVDVWTLVWYFTRDHALSGAEQFWVVGLVLTGLTLIVLGLLLLMSITSK